MTRSNKIDITTIKIEKKTKDRLDSLNEHNETYNELITKLINILNICRTKPLLANRILRDIERSKKREKLIENPEKMLRKRNPFQETQERKLPQKTQQPIETSNSLPRLTQQRPINLQRQIRPEFIKK